MVWLPTRRQYGDNPTQNQREGDFDPSDPWTWTDADARAMGWSNAADAQKGFGARAPKAFMDWLYDPNLTELGTEGRDAFAAQISQAQQRGDLAYENQIANLQNIQAIAEGRAPSVAQMQMQSGLEQNQQMLMGALASQRGGNVGATAGIMAQANAQNAQTIARETSMLRAAEVQEAYKLLNASYAEIQAMQFQQAMFYETLGYTIDEANRQAAMDIAKAQANAALGLSTAGTGAEAQIGGQAVGGFFEAVGTAAAAAVKTYSDARVKENVRAADEDIEQLLDALNAYSYEYTATVRDSPFAGPGRHVGIMAQDLARTRQGRELLVDFGGILGYDVKKATSASLAGLANVNKRLRRQEQIVNELLSALGV